MPLLPLLPQQSARACEHARAHAPCHLRCVAAASAWTHIAAGQHPHSYSDWDAVSGTCHGRMQLRSFRSPHCALPPHRIPTTAFRKSFSAIFAFRFLLAAWTLATVTAAEPPLPAAAAAAAAAAVARGPEEAFFSGLWQGVQALSQSPPLHSAWHQCELPGTGRFIKSKYRG